MAKVKATAEGFDGVQIRKKGEVFDFEGPIGSWMEVVDKKEESKSSKESKDGKGKDEK